MAGSDVALAGAALATGAIEVTRTASTIPIQFHEVPDHDEVEAGAREALGEARFNAAVGKGRWIALDEMIVRVRDAADARVATLRSGEPVVINIAERFGLTPREHEILLLLARRYADKEIAEELSISPRTVARHVTGIFTKLNVHSRREAAALVGSLP
jgi:DNA-binding CsgD family transcriptional regulator